LIEIAALETEIVAKISAYATTVNVEVFPEDVAKYRMTHPVGAILVAYDGRNYNNAQVNQQLVSLRFSVIVLTRNLRSHSGAYAILDNALDGATAAGLIPISENFIKYEDGIWYFEQKYSLPAIFNTRTE